MSKEPEPKYENAMEMVDQWYSHQRNGVMVTKKIPCGCYSPMLDELYEECPFIELCEDAYHNDGVATHEQEVPI
jgi:hypothetical protein